MPTRRHFLQGLGAAGLAALAAPRLAHAGLGGAVFGCQTYKVLHIYLHGALSHRETLWVDDDSHGWAPWREPADLGNINFLAGGATRTPFANTTDHQVSLGEGLYPLVGAGWGHRLRVVAMSTPSPEVHRIASGTSLAGIEVGRPGFASLAARMLARHGPDDPYASFVIDALGSPVVSRYAVTAQGLSGGSEPVVLPVGGAGSDFLADLQRGDRDHVDGLLGLYRNRYSDALRHPTDGALRSKGFDTYATAVDRLRNWPGLHDRLQAVPSFAVEGDEPWSETVQGIEVATHLLSTGARHVTVLGAGANAGTLDTHALGDIGEFAVHAERHNGFLWHVSVALLAAIAEGRLDPANTLVVLHSEFGRAQRNNGTEHHGKGYAALLFGGPVQQSGVAGRLDFSNDAEGIAVDGYTPADLIAAASLAGGIAPLQPGMFDRSHLSHPGANDDEAVANLAYGLLGAVDETCVIDDIAG